MDEGLKHRTSPVSIRWDEIARKIWIVTHVSSSSWYAQVAGCGDGRVKSFDIPLRVVSEVTLFVVISTSKFRFLEEAVNNLFI